MGWVLIPVTRSNGGHLLYGCVWLMVNKYVSWSVFLFLSVVYPCCFCVHIRVTESSQCIFPSSFIYRKENITSLHFETKETRILPPNLNSCSLIGEHHVCGWETVALRCVCPSYYVCKEPNATSIYADVTSLCLACEELWGAQRWRQLLCGGGVWSPGHTFYLRAPDFVIRIFLVIFFYLDGFRFCANA